MLMGTLTKVSGVMIKRMVMELISMLMEQNMMVTPKK